MNNSIHWCIIRFDKEVTQLALRILSVRGFSVQGTIAMRHCIDKLRAVNMRDAAISDMKLHARTGRAFIITGEQFQAGTTKYKANERSGSPEQLGGIQGTYDDWVMFFPATQMQIQESITF